jgi:hypothetical protein
MADPPMLGFVVSGDPPRLVKLHYRVVFLDCCFDPRTKVTCRIGTHGNLFSALPHRRAYQTAPSLKSPQVQARRFATAKADRL